MASHARHHVETAQHRISPAAAYDIAAAYNAAGENYVAYADGDPQQLFAFSGRYSYGDRYVWELLETKLRALKVLGAQSVRILDLGCGPGTWLRRIVTRARALGFRHVYARGFDIAAEQIRRAQTLAAPLAAHRNIDLRFEVADISERLPEQDASIDICLCLCGVLNHLPSTGIASVLAEVGRVTRGDFVATVRATGSMPTVYVDAIERARQFRQDNDRNRLDVEFQNGRRISLNSHLYSAAELRSWAGRHMAIKDLLGLDLFHSRFAGDARWNPRGLKSPVPLNGELGRLENIYCRNTAFIDHATHLLLVGTHPEFGRAREANTRRQVHGTKISTGDLP